MRRICPGAAMAVMFTMAVGQPQIALGQPKPAARPTVRTINVQPLSFEGTASFNRTIDVAPLVFEGVSVHNQTVNVSPLVFEGDYVAQKLPAMQPKGVQK